MLSFKQYLHEARRNASHPAQKKLNALEILSKYKDDPNVHISFTKINKIGLNPKTGFTDTPVAVYTYPLKQVWNDIEKEGVSNVPFAASDAKYVFILKERRKPLVDVSEYSKSDLENDLKKISKMIPKEDYEKGISKVEGLSGETPKTTKHRFRFLKLVLYFASDVNKTAPFMSKALLDLGYSGFSDRLGRGEIHPAEEIQSFFLSSRFYTVLESIDLKSLDFKSMDRRDRAKFIKKNASKMSDDEIIDLIRDDVELLKYAGPPRTEVLKFAIGNDRNEIWKSQQKRPKEDPTSDFESSSNLYSPGEQYFGGARVLNFYNKLPEDFVLWAIKSGHGHNISFWARSNKNKFRDSFIDKIFSIDPSLALKLKGKVTVDFAKKYYKVEKSLWGLSDFMTKEDYKAFLSSLDEYEPPSNYDQTVAEDLYGKLMKKKNPTEDDIFSTAKFIQKAGVFRRNNLPMDLINGLKDRFPDFDFSIVGNWGFWKR